MKKGIIFFLIFILVLIVGFIMLYFLYEKPMEKQVETSTAVLNIFATNNNTNIITGYKVYVNGLLYANGTTLIDGYSYQKVPTNSTILIQSYNLNNQKYYTSEYSTFVTTNNFYRIPLDLKNPGKLNITQTGRLNGSHVYLNVSSIYGDYKDLQFCLDWSIHIVTVRINYTRIIEYEYPESHCYTPSITLNSTNSFFLDLGYIYYDKLDKADFIKVNFYDSDCAVDTCAMRQNNYTILITY